MTPTSHPTTTSAPGPRTQPSLTDRYVHAVTRRLGDDQRDDVALELRASIEDRVEAHLDADPTATRESAEHQALVELGDPDRLSAGYSGAPQHLIGPDLYPTFVRTVRAILVTVVPISTVVIAAVDALEGEPFGSIVGHAVWAALTVAVHIVFWTTLAFVVTERSGAPGRAKAGTAEWTPEQLPHLPMGPREALGEAVTNVAWLGILAALLVGQHLFGVVDADGDRVPVLDPDLWSSWMPVVLAALALEAGFEVVKYRAGGTWTTRFAALNTATGAVFAAPLAWLAYDQSLLNPAFVARAQEGWPEFDAGVTHTIVLVSAVAIWLWDSIDGGRKALRPL